MSHPQMTQYSKKQDPHQGDATGHNKPWRYNNGTNTATHTNPQGCTTRPSGHSGFHKNSPNSSDNRNRPTCFKCGEQGHMRMDCRKEFSAHTAGLQTMTQKHAENNTTMPQAHKQPHSSRISPHSNTTATNGSNYSHTTNTTNRCNQQYTIVPEAVRKQPDKNTVQWHIPSTINQHDRSPDTN